MSVQLVKHVVQPFGLLRSEHYSRVQTLAKIPTQFSAMRASLLFAVALAAFDYSSYQKQSKLKGSVGEGPNQTNYSDRSSVRILEKFRSFR